MRLALWVGIILGSVCLVHTAHAGDPPPLGTPPAEAKSLVDAPKEGEAAPKIDKDVRDTTATVSAGGQLATGNSRLVAATVNGKFEMRRGANGFGASLVGNYGEGAAAPANANPLHVTTENLQARLRYDRYLGDRVSVFLIGTYRTDRFQGIDMRNNLDPGFKYLFVNDDALKFWGEAGYDFQVDVRRDDSLLNADGTRLDKRVTDHSGRLFFGLKYAFNKEVTLTTGLEYLQSFVDSTRYRLNYDVLFAANVGGGLALGLGFAARYDHAPLPGKEELDTQSTVSLIYSFSDLPPK